MLATGPRPVGRPVTRACYRARLRQGTLAPTLQVQVSADRPGAQNPNLPSLPLVEAEDLLTAQRTSQVSWGDDSTPNT
jgi:hypothetical protein